MAPTYTANYAAGQLLLASDLNTSLNYHRAVRVIKAVDESRTSSGAYANDAELSLALEANAEYELLGHIIYDSATTPDIAMKFTVPVGCTGFWAGHSLSAATTLIAGTVDMGHAAITTGIAFGGAGTGTGFSVVARFGGYIINGVNAGAAQLQWAQNASTATATVIRANSWLRIRRSQ